MPTENERKFVLKFCENEIQSKHEKLLLLQQGYLAFAKGMTLRVRKEVNQHSGKTKHKMCFKQSVKNRMGVVEIDNLIDERDFDDLWNVSVNQVSKRRHILKFKNSDEVWEVDFFTYDDDTYFAMAEVELPEERVAPNSIPDIIKRNLLYEVPISEQDKFSTKQLASVGYAKDLYRKCLENVTQIAAPSVTNS